MAVKLTSRKKIKRFDVGVEDETLNEVLSAGKTNLTYKNGQVIPDTPLLIEDEPLIIEKNPTLVSYEDVQERSVQYAKEKEKDKKTDKKEVFRDSLLNRAGNPFRILCNAVALSPD